MAGRPHLADAHQPFTDPKIHLLLLTRAGRLVATLLRSDLPACGPERADEQARWFGSCAGRVDDDVRSRQGDRTSRSTAAPR